MSYNSDLQNINTELAEILQTIDDLPIEKEDCMINVKSFGVMGDGETDDTSAINSIIDAASEQGKIVYFPEGTYMVSASMSSDLSDDKRYYAIRIYEKNGLKIILSPNAKIKLMTSEDGEIIANEGVKYYVFGIYKSSNITICGGCVEGDADQLAYPYVASNGTSYSTAEGAGFYIYGCEKIIIKDVETCNCYGLGIQTALTNENDLTSKLIIENCFIHHCTVRGIHIEGCEQTDIKNSHITNIKDAGNNAIGLSIYTENEEYPNKYITVDNCLVTSCKFCFVAGGKNLSTIIQNTKLLGKTSAFSNYQSSSGITFKNSIFLYVLVPPTTGSCRERNRYENCIFGNVDVYGGAIFKNCIFDLEYFDNLTTSSSKPSEIYQYLLSFKKNSSVAPPEDGLYMFTLDSCELRFPKGRGLDHASGDGDLPSFIPIRWIGSPEQYYQQIEFINSSFEMEGNYYGNYGLSGTIKNNTFYIKKGMTLASGVKVTLSAPFDKTTIFENNTIDTSYFSSTVDATQGMLTVYCGNTSGSLIINNNTFLGSPSLMRAIKLSKTDIVDGKKLNIMCTNNQMSTLPSDKFLTGSSSLTEDQHYSLITANNLFSDTGSQTTKTLSIEYEDGTSENIQMVVQL